MKAIIDQLVMELESANHDICRLCKRVNPQHADCDYCQEHDDRKKIIESGKSLPGWPRIDDARLLKLAGEILFFQGGRTGHGTYITLIYGKLKLELRSIGVEIIEEKK